MIVTLTTDSTSFLAEHHSEIDWTAFVNNNPITREIVYACAKYLDWTSASWMIDISDIELIECCKQHLDWGTITIRAFNTKLLNATSVFMQRFATLLDWACISSQHKLSITFLKKYSKYIFWNLVSYSNFTVKMFKQFHNFVDWERLVCCYDLELNEMIELRDYIPWHLVARHQDLSEEDIVELSTTINWVDVAACQDISLDFISKYRDALPLESLRKNPYLVDKMRDVLAMFDIPEIDLTPTEHTDPCPICRDADGHCHKIKCGHVFHRECILAWTEKCRTCPMCRTEL